jgi:23S rRNA maturation mini-RNase III
MTKQRIQTLFFRPTPLGFRQVVPHVSCMLHRTGKSTNKQRIQTLQLTEWEKELRSDERDLHKHGKVANVLRARSFTA